MKRKIIVIIVLIFLMLIPIPMKLKDGGLIEYRALLYNVTKYHVVNPQSIKGYDDGWKFEILGLTIYNKINTYVSAEHIINIKTGDKTIKANTGSFCYKNGTCLDKVDFKKFNYDIITSYYNNKLYIHNLNGSIESVELFDYSSNKFIKTPVEFTNEYIITPNINGLYIFKINAIYESKHIEYYFMTQINDIEN